MSQITHILVTTDFTESCARAFSWAFELASKHNARVTLCHVLVAPSAPNPVYAQFYPRSLFRRETWEPAEHGAEEALRSHIPAAHTAVAHDFAVSRGVAADEIVRQAEERACDLIVLAAGRRLHLLGSVAEKVVRRARCAVLVVR